MRAGQSSHDRQYRPGVGMMVLNPKNQVLLCRRVGIPDGWQMPQGGIDDGEDPRTAAFRELVEEIGTNAVEILAETKRWHRYDLPPQLVGVAWDGRFVGQRQKWFLMRFKGSENDINLETPHPEFDKWIWVPPDHVASRVVSFKQNLYKSVLAEFRSHLRAAGSAPNQPWRNASSGRLAYLKMMRRRQ